MRRSLERTLGALALAVAGATARGQAAPKYTHADVRFMQGMIGHHGQALTMTALIPDRTSNRDIQLLGERIEVSQKDEIRLMQQWLRDRNQDVPDAESREHMHMPGMAMSDTLMPGMLTTQQLSVLAHARGKEFDRLFLTDMIRHHEGALAMVASLLGSTASGQEPEVFRFASEVDSDQRAEIARMNGLLNALGSSGAGSTR